MPLKNWFSIHARWSKSSLKHSIRFPGIFSKFKTEFYWISFFKIVLTFRLHFWNSPAVTVGCIKKSGNWRHHVYIYIYIYIYRSWTRWWKHQKIVKLWFSDCSPPMKSGFVQLPRVFEIVIKLCCNFRCCIPTNHVRVRRSLLLYTHNHNDIDNNGTANTYSVKNRQIHVQLRKHLLISWLRFFDTRRETQFLKVFRIILC